MLSKTILITGKAGTGKTPTIISLITALGYEASNLELVKKKNVGPWFIEWQNLIEMKTTVVYTEINNPYHSVRQRWLAKLLEYAKIPNFPLLIISSQFEIDTRFDKNADPLFHKIRLEGPYSPDLTPTLIKHVVDGIQNGGWSYPVNCQPKLK